MWFDDVKISIDSEEIEVIKNGLIENRYIDECEFEIESDKLDYTICDAYMMPITFIVDTRNNVNPEYVILLLLMTLILLINATALLRFLTA